MSDAPKLRPAKSLTDDELSQELYNCAAFLTSQCEEDAEADAANLELVALIMQRMEALVVELAGGESVASLAKKATDEDREVLASTDARVALPDEEVVPS